MREWEQRFWAKVSPEPNSGCWFWAGSVDAKGYGQLGIEGHTRTVHRLAWEMVDGPIPSGLQVLHRCDQPACVNVAHLFLGTCADNMSDKVTKGRQARGPALNSARGERHYAAKVTEAIVAEIRSRVRPGREQGPGRQPDSIRSLAREFGLDAMTVQRIVKRTTWRHM